MSTNTSAHPAAQSPKIDTVMSTDAPASSSNTAASQADAQIEKVRVSFQQLLQLLRSKVDEEKFVGKKPLDVYDV